MIVHCNMKFQPDEIMFLRDNEMFTHRRIETGICPKCEKFLVRFIEKRIIDGKYFDSTYKEQSAKRVINEYKDDVEYSTKDIPKLKTVLHGFRYGENFERKNPNTGEVIITQKAVDFNGNKEVVKKYISK